MTRRLVRLFSTTPKRHGIPEAVAFEQARRYAREIVPVVFGLYVFQLCHSVGSMAEQHVLQCAPQPRGRGRSVKEIDPKATGGLCNESPEQHGLRSGNLWLAAQQSALSYAVGEWARVWPLSRLIRAMGAYFIRRKSGSELYRQVLASYVRLATDAGVTQAMFPEGGLSLDRALWDRPKLGFAEIHHRRHQSRWSRCCVRACCAEL